MYVPDEVLPHCPLELRINTMTPCLNSDFSYILTWSKVLRMNISGQLNPDWRLSLEYTLHQQCKFFGWERVTYLRTASAFLLQPNKAKQHHRYHWNSNVMSNRYINVLYTLPPKTKSVRTTGFGQMPPFYSYSSQPSNTVYVEEAVSKSPSTLVYIYRFKSVIGKLLALKCWLHPPRMIPSNLRHSYYSWVIMLNSCTVSNHDEFHTRQSKCCCAPCASMITHSHVISAKENWEQHIISMDQ